MKILFSLLLSLTFLQALSDEDKIKIITEHLIQKQSTGLSETERTVRINEITKNSRSQAISIVYGKASLEDLVYDESSQMFFAKVVSEKGDFTQDVNFYMPKRSARSLQENLESSDIKIQHSFEADALVFDEFDLEYKGINYPMAKTLPDNIQLRLGFIQVQDQETIIAASSNGVGGHINVQNLFQLPTNYSGFRLDAYYKFNAKHGIEFSYYAIDSESFVSANDSFSWKGETISHGASLETFFNTDIYKLNYTYAMYKGDTLALSARAGIHLTSIDIGFKGSYSIEQTDGNILNLVNSDQAISVPAPLPVFGLQLDYKIMPRLNLKFVTDFFFVSINGISGNMQDSILSVDYRVTDNFGLGMGINHTNLKLVLPTDGVQFDFRNSVSSYLFFGTVTY